ncbi:molluscan insulin-related peptide 7-like [Physella acuta]|uniref:molluscan insulin-related peptide 7-like n=1 Tax=Physella acuta TaxID=109671 RepID=UPI0027DC9B8E|nr:molluscan insulin-related peptide 7-like [Physella acuta]
MNASMARCLALMLAVVTLSNRFTQGQEAVQTTTRAACNLDSRPHPQGLCGSKLSRAHSNLCFLLMNHHTSLFRPRRSAGQLEHNNRIYNIPLAVLAELELNRESWDSYVSKRNSDQYSLTSEEDGPVLESPFDNSLEETDNIMNELLRIFRINSNRYKRETEIPGMVCDCCYNLCRPRELAAYC